MLFTIFTKKIITYCLSNIFKAKIYYCAAIAIILLNACRSQPEHLKNTNSENSADTTQTQDSYNIPQIKQLTERIQKDTNNAELYFLRANLLLQANEAREAMTNYAKAIEKDSLNPAYYLAAADLYFKAEQVPSAAALLMHATKTLKKPNADVFAELGKYYFYGAKYEQANQFLDNALQLDNKRPDVFFWKAMCLKDQKQLQPAITNFKKSIQLNPQSYNAYMMLAQTLAELKDKQCITYYEKAFAIDSTKSEALYGKAMFWQNTGDTDLAINAYKNLITHDPQFQDAYYNVGYIYFLQKKYPEAQKHFELAIRVSPAFAKAYYMRGLCSENQNKPAEARADYKRALNFDPKLTLALEALNRIGS